MGATRASLEGKVAVVTGSTSGIGQETAVGLAARGAKVVLVGRNPARAEDALRDVRSRSGNDDVEVALADFESLAAVRDLAQELRERFPTLHLLVNNAGVVMTERFETTNGFETTLAVNHLAPFLLTNLLSEPLRAGSARIVTVASGAHGFVNGFDFDDPMSKQKFGFPSMLTGMRVYGMSKLANILFSNELARRTQGTGITSNAVHPGAVATRLGSNNGWLGSVATAFMRPFFLTPEQGAATSLHVATAPELEKTTGRYFANCKQKKTTPGAQDAQAAARLWQESCQWVGISDEGFGA